MSEQSKLADQRAQLVAAEEQGTLSTLKTYVKLSGPGWLQSALTLGGGSLGSSLYLGILAGTSLLWLQPYAMILGVVMLSAISYVALSTGESPFRAINQHINPVLGWSWLLASLLANMVWALPQYSLCFAVIEQNLFPQLFETGGPLSPDKVGPDGGKWIVSIVILALCTCVTWSYGSGSWGVKLYDIILKVVVAVIVACFIGVVVRISLSPEGIDWAGVGRGLIPDLRYFFHPAESFTPLLEKIQDENARQYWTNWIVSEQRDVMISAGATAVGINMTFLLPFSLLSRGWDKAYRGLCVFDLCTSTFVPFVLATGCVVIAAATQFHTRLPADTVVTASSVEVPERLQGGLAKMLDKRNEDAQKNGMPGAPSLAEQEMAAVLVRRDTFELARSLNQLFATEDGSSGSFFSNIVFGVGVAGMTLSTITLLMLISGFVFCEVFRQPATGWVFRIGCLAAATGVLWPLIWSGQSRTWLTIVASVFGAMLLPIAYVTFFVLLNQKSFLGNEMPRGGKRAAWNVLMAIAALSATAASLLAVYKKLGYQGLGVVAAYLVLLAIVQVMRKKPEAQGSS